MADGGRLAQFDEGSDDFLAVIEHHKGRYGRQERRPTARGDVTYRYMPNIHVAVFYCTVVAFSDYASSDYMIGLTNPTGLSCTDLSDCSNKLQWSESGNALLDETWMDNLPMNFGPSDVVGVFSLAGENIYGMTAFASPGAFLCQASCV